MSWKPGIAHYGIAAALFACLIWLPPSALAQRAVPRSGSDQPSTGGRTQGDSGGGRVSSGDGRVSSDGNTSSGDDQSSGRRSGGTVRRAPSGEEKARSGETRTAVRRDRGGSGTSGDNAAASGDNPKDSGVTSATAGGATESVPPYSRPRGNNPATGRSVERKGRPPLTGDGDTVWIPGGYYGGYYPWGYGAFGLGGYYGGYYDPWYYGGSQPYDAGYDYDGRLRLKVKPRTAEVFVDGYFAGVVDEFDGVFQRLRIEPGPHRIEIRADGFEPLQFDVRITPDHTTTYSGEMKAMQ